MELLSIQEEAEVCRAAFAGVYPDCYVWHIHRKQLVDQLVKGAESRIAYMLMELDRTDLALRLRLFRPVAREHDPVVAVARQVYKKAQSDAMRIYTRSGFAGEDAPSARQIYSRRFMAATKVRDEACAAAHAADCLPDCPWGSTEPWDGWTSQLGAIAPPEELGGG